MKRVKLIFSLIVVMLMAMPATMLAQTPLAKYKKWSEGPLIWADFRGKSVVEGVPSYLKATLSISPEEYEPGSKAASYRLAAEAIANCRLPISTRWMTNACAITSCNSMCSNTIAADCSPNSIRACRASKPRIVCATIRCSLPTV